MLYPIRVLSVLALLLAAAGIGRADDSQPAAAQPVLVDISPSDADNDGGLCPAIESLDCDCCPPVWTVSTGAIFLHRSRPDANQIVHPVGSTATVSNGSDYTFGTVAVAPDITIARRLRSGNSFQLRFFGGADWNTGTNYGAVGNVQIGSFSNFGATSLTSTYNSRLYSTEFNWLRPVGDRVTFLAGFRALEVREVLGYHIGFPAFTANYSWQELNQLYGAQMGAIVNLWHDDSRLAMNCGLKAGVFGNTATNTFNLIPSTGGSFPGGASTTATSFVGDINFNASYQLTRHIAIRGGYQVLWVQDLALASNQAALATQHATQNGISTRGDLFYNGATASVVVSW